MTVGDKSGVDDGTFTSPCKGEVAKHSEAGGGRIFYLCYCGLPKQPPPQPSPFQGEGVELPQSNKLGV